MPVFSSPGRMTELQAVNRMLANIGEAPLPDATDLTQEQPTDVAQAIEGLRNTLRETQVLGWNFNWMPGVQVGPEDQIVVDGVSRNIFKVPANVLRWELTSCPENRDLDVIERMSDLWLPGDVSLSCLWDRRLNREYHDPDKYPFIYLDMVLAQPWEVCPVEFQWFCVVAASRVFAQNATSSTTLQQFQAMHEERAYRALKKFQPRKPRANMFNNPTTAEVMGGRPYRDGRTQRRVNWFRY